MKGIKSLLKMYVLLMATILFSCSNRVQNPGKLFYQPTDGFVPNADTAIKIAEALWLPIYRDEIDSKLFKASLINNVWIVEANLKPTDKEVSHIEISKKDCSVITRQPVEGYVVNEETAIKIAEAVWLPVYGYKIYSEQPFKAQLANDVWTVKGTLKTSLGGVLYIEISKKDCRILEMYHGK
jgi:hypothetical protein